MAEGKFKEMEAHATAMVQAWPEDAAGRYYRCWAFLGQNKPAESLPDLARALEIEPANAQLYAARGYAHALLNNVRGFSQDMQKASELDPRDAVVPYLTGESYRVLNARQPKEYGKELALSNFKKAVGLAPTNESYLAAYQNLRAETEKAAAAAHRSSSSEQEWTTGEKAAAVLGVLAGAAILSEVLSGGGSKGSAAPQTSDPYAPPKTWQPVSCSACSGTGQQMKTEWGRVGGGWGWTYPKVSCGYCGGTGNRPY
ncbi:MAG: hypothetical protein ACO1TE_29410 [Prosthecobacter sp.]